MCRCVPCGVRRRETDRGGGRGRRSWAPRSSIHRRPSSAEALARIQAPVLGLYGGDDARVNKTIPSAETEMKRLGKSYQPEIYDGAGHGFLRAQEGQDGANLRATQKAWPETISFLKKELGS